MDKGVSFRTNRPRRTSYNLWIDFYTVEPQIRTITSMKIKFNNYAYSVKKCVAGFGMKLENVPKKIQKTWFIRRRNSNLTLLCNGVTVLHLKLKGGGCKSIDRANIEYIKIAERDDSIEQITVNNSRYFFIKIFLNNSTRYI